MLDPRRRIAQPLLAALCASLALACAGCDTALPAPDDPASAVPGGLDVKTRPPGDGGQLDATADTERNDSAVVSDTGRDDTGVMIGGAPEIVSLEPDPNPIAPGGTTTVTVVATDPDDDPLTYEWTVRPLSWIPSERGSVTNFELTAPDFSDAPEQASIDLIVRDPNGNFARRGITVRTDVATGEPCPVGEAHCAEDATCAPFDSGLGPLCPLRSCLSRLVADPEAASGVQWIQPSDDTEPTEVFCDMDSSGGGWTVVADDDYASGDPCPDGWGRVDSPALCYRDLVDTDGARSAFFDTAGLEWAEMAAAFRGLRGDTTDAFPDTALDIESDQYVDGVSFTVGSEPRTHLWSFAYGRRYLAMDATVCPCRGGPAAPMFAENHWGCLATGETTGSGWFTSDPVRGTTGLGVRCDTNSRPDVSFERSLDTATTDPVEVRLMASNISSEEGIGITQMRVAVREAERCNGVDDDFDGLVDEPGCGPDNPAESCRDIRDQGGWAGSGRYWIQPRSDGDVLDVYCDMHRDGGGWTLAVVCRPHDTRCQQTEAVSKPAHPWIAGSAKLDDEDIRALLDLGTAETRGHWRQLGRIDQGLDHRTAIIFNRLLDIGGHSSAPCSTAVGTPVQLRALPKTSSDDVLLHESLDELSAELDAAGTGITRIDTADGSCSCPASGWSIGLPNDCASGWSGAAEGGPTLYNDSGDSLTMRAEVIVWVR